MAQQTRSFESRLEDLGTEQIMAVAKLDEALRATQLEGEAALAAATREREEIITNLKESAAAAETELRAQLDASKKDAEAARAQWDVDRITLENQHGAARNETLHEIQVLKESCETLRNENKALREEIVRVKASNSQQELQKGTRVMKMMHLKSSFAW